ncbi:ABC transporter permease [Clostridium pasteurianum]|uniref:ABC-type anion transport system, duplicated permease component n=1 Tax=Clostridium pasteurianum BC1 TaxID=86416 RepID=R4K448_CLOPA|nr:ABC transporter permease subunit [Clostridium pasteurianum]AGK95314.1 ABC-type anion transport system, duplicated permease component [Clostridium pasteurianum BC1]
MRNEKVFNRQKFGMIDIVIFICIAMFIYLIMSPGMQGASSNVNVKISTDLNMLPYYALRSVLRMTAAYIISIIFTLVYGYIAAHNPKAEKILIPILDILQSIPVLSFLPAVVLGLIALFPNGTVGVEIASIILIFTGQAWNMTFSFYYSLKVLPRDLKEASSVLQLNKWQQFKKLELPFATIGLVWNSMMSWAGGWFFLMACEMFTLRGRNFRLKGIGSFLQTAANEGNTKALIYGIATLIIVIILLDQFIWRPVITWSDKFKVELTQSNDEPKSFVLKLLRRSYIVQVLTEKLLEPFFTFIGGLIDKFISNMNKNKGVKNEKAGKIIKIIIRAAAIIVAIYLGFNVIKLLSTLRIRDLQAVPKAVLFSLLRVIAAQVIALIWTVPVGVAIGMNRKLANVLQPVIQIIASIPATALFPVVLGIFMSVLGGLGFASIILMLMGTQWYILFNVVAGAMAIPEDLKAATKTFGITGLKKWKTLILPGIFPYLVTGMITATGGCWNASIVSEYVNFGGHSVKTIGLGALISQATESGNFALLLMGTITMCIVVVVINNVVWKRLYTLAEERFKIEM